MAAGAQRSTTVLIVGAGPTGLALACGLARGGVPFRLIEAAPGPQPGSRGKGLQPRSLEVFDDLGLVDRVLAHGRMAMPMRSVAPDGQATQSGPSPLAGRPDIPYPASLITPQWRTEEALRERLAELGGAVEFGTVLRSFAQTNAGVTAVLEKADPGGEMASVAAEWLVGCDGGHSAVRKQAGIAFEGETREDVRMIVADLQVEGLDRDAWHLWRHAEGMVSLCPLPSTDVFQYQEGLAPGQAPGLRLEALQATLARRSGRSDLRLHDLAWSSVWRANIRLAQRYRVKRVFIAGDAAHIHSPAGGQGMNTGIQDAHNLSWKLVAIDRGAPTALLDTYEAERRPVAADVLALSNNLLKQAIEQKGMSIRRDASTMQLGVGYRGALLAQDDRAPDAALRAGDRAPDAPGLATVDGERRLFELLRGGGFTLLCFGPPPAKPRAELRTLRVVQQAAKAGDLVDTQGHLAAAYGATERTFVLLRPDGYVALISDAGDAAAVSGYFAVHGLS